MAKRSAATDLNRDNCDVDDPPEDPGVFKQASEEDLKKRVIRTARRRCTPTTQEGDAVKNVFAGFSGFSQTKQDQAAKPTFSFLSTARSGSNGTDGKSGDSGPVSVNGTVAETSTKQSKGTKWQTSHYHNQMDKGEGDEVSCQSTSKGTGLGMSGLSEGVSVQLHERMKKFLDKEDFEAGSPLSNTETSSVIKELGRSTDMFRIDSMDQEYISFLNKYRSIDGPGFSIRGPSEYDSDKVKRMLSIQRGFEYRCKIDSMKEAQAKSCWLIAGIDQGGEYYIKLSETNKHYVYSMSHDGKSKIFAKGFLEFLDKFFEAYNRKDEEKSYEEDLYEEE